MISKSPRSALTSPCNPGRLVDLGGAEPLGSRRRAGEPGSSGTDRRRKGAAFPALGGSTTPSNPHRIRQQDVQPGASALARRALPP